MVRMTVSVIRLERVELRYITWLYAAHKSINFVPKIN